MDKATFLIQVNGGRDDYVVEPGALQIPDTPLPVTVEYDHERIIGKADNFKLKGDQIQVDITFDPSIEKIEFPEDIYQLFPEYYANQYEAGNAKGDPFRLIKGRLLGASFCKIL